MYTYTPNEDPIFESLKTIPLDPSCLGEVLSTPLTGVKAPHYGCRADDAQRKRMSDAQKNTKNHSTRGKKRPEFAKLMAGKNNPMYGVPSPYISKGDTAELVTCPHCGKVGGKPAMHRWHFDSCKVR